MIYNSLNKTAQRLIDQFGKDADLIRTEQTGDPWDPTETEVKHLVRMVETGYEMNRRSDTVIEAGDKLGIISTAGEAPLLSDDIEIDGERYGLVDVQPLNPGGVTMLYQFQARA